MKYIKLSYSVKVLKNAYLGWKIYMSLYWNNALSCHKMNNRCKFTVPLGKH